MLCWRVFVDDRKPEDGSLEGVLETKLDVKAARLLPTVLRCWRCWVACGSRRQRFGWAAERRPRRRSGPKGG